jgi:hypothetical protein
MFGWLKKAMASGPSGPREVRGETVEYKGYQLTPTPIPEGGQYRVSGVIVKPGEPEQRHAFIRSDLVAGEDEACNFTLVKARLMIDQLGDRLFDN